VFKKLFNDKSNKKTGVFLGGFEMLNLIVIDKKID